MIHPGANAALVAAMEEVLDGYRLPRAAACPLVSLDEIANQLLKEARAPMAAKKGQAARYDYATCH